MLDKYTKRLEEEIKSKDKLIKRLGNMLNEKDKENESGYTEEELHNKGLYPEHFRYGKVIIKYGRYSVIVSNFFSSLL